MLLGHFIKPAFIYIASDYCYKFEFSASNISSFWCETALESLRFDSMKKCITYRDAFFIIIIIFNKIEYIYCCSNQIYCCCFAWRLRLFSKETVIIVDRTKHKATFLRLFRTFTSTICELHTTHIFYVDSSFYYRLYIRVYRRIL